MRQDTDAVLDYNRVFINHPTQGIKIFNIEQWKQYRINDIALKENHDRCVYFILDKRCNHLKIGQSYNVKRRMAQLQTACATKLILLAITKDYTEKELHKKFSKYRLWGEWFDYTGELKLFINVHIKNAEEC